MGWVTRRSNSTIDTRDALIEICRPTNRVLPSSYRKFAERKSGRYGIRVQKRLLAGCKSGYSLALAGVDAGRLSGDPALAGRYLESYVMQQLRPQGDAIGGVLTHMRTGAGQHEVDAVVEVGRDVYAMRSSWVSAPLWPTPAPRVVA